MHKRPTLSKNCRDSRVFKVCSPLQLSCIVTGNRPSQRPPLRDNPLLTIPSTVIHHAPKTLNKFEKLEIIELSLLILFAI